MATLEELFTDRLKVMKFYEDELRNLKNISETTILNSLLENSIKRKNLLWLRNRKYPGLFKFLKEFKNIIGELEDEDREYSVEYHLKKLFVFFIKNNLSPKDGVKLLDILVYDNEYPRKKYDYTLEKHNERIEDMERLLKIEINSIDKLMEKISESEKYINNLEKGIK